MTSAGRSRVMRRQAAKLRVVAGLEVGRKAAEEATDLRGRMATERKREQVALLEERLGRASITIGIDYRGLSVKDMQQLRRGLRSEAPDTELRVIKNTLWRRAAEDAGEPGAAELAEEATALLFGFGDLTEAPRALQKYTRDARLELPIRGVYVEGQLQDGSQVTALADVPSRPELMAKVAGGLNSPVAGLAGALSAMFRDVAAIIEARAEQLESAEAGAE
ncbi:MAG: 50S ribosomal protein L10 [Chloroflexi bacterium]|nr:50S ribosomal protein L10 [Chloroflexota bacterium]MYD15978.1 50S ribosomal protein L10 [Chloroflexota bacterium]